MRSTELSILTWAMALKKSSEWTKRTVYPARMAVKPRAWARKLLPTPAGAGQPDDSGGSTGGLTWRPAGPTPPVERLRARYSPLPAAKS